MKLLTTLLMAVILATITLTTTNAQRLNEDSIRKVIAETKSDTTRIIAMRKLASYLILHKGQDSAGLAMLSEADAQARKLNFQTGICEVLLTQGNYYARKNDWANAIEKFRALELQSHQIPDSIVSKRTRMIALNNLAGIYTQNGDYTTALDNYLKSRAIVETLPANMDALCRVYINIAGIYNALEQTAKADEYLQRCYPLLDSAKPDLRYIYWQERQNAADKNKDAKMVALAIDSLEKAVASGNLSDFQLMQYSETVQQMRGNYLADYEKKYPAARENFLSMLNLAKQMEDGPEIYSALYEIGETYYHESNYKEAIDYLEQAYRGAVSDSVNQIVFQSSRLLADIYHKQNNDSKAFNYLSMAYSLNDSLNTEKNLAQLNFLEASYQNARKEKEIADLRTTNAENELAVVKRNRLIIIGGIAAVALLFVLGLLYRNSKQKQTIAENKQRLKEEQIRFLERQQQVISLQSMINGQESERIRIAKDLHDGLGGVFSTVKMHYSTLQKDIPQIKENPLYMRTLDLINNASDEVRKVAHNMMPEVLMKVGLIEALEDFSRNISSGKLLNLKLQAYGMEKRLSSSTEIMVYRIIQELVNNIIKHAEATEAIIQFNREGNRLSITIEDNGRGFNTMEAEQRKTMGMVTVRNRVDYLNGRLTIDSREGVGTTVMIDLLLNEN